jgi:hypothetical protein
LTLVFALLAETRARVDSSIRFNFEDIGAISAGAVVKRSGLQNEAQARIRELFAPSVDVLLGHVHENCTTARPLPHFC